LRILLLIFTIVTTLDIFTISGLHTW
jgi:hypothetical protein